jgi:MFS family permease
MRGFGRRFFAGSVLIGGVALTQSAMAADAQPAGPTLTAATAKGVVGGALLGAEAVMLTEAAADVKQGWAYGLGGGLGAVAGGVGGYFAEHGGDARLSLYLLVGGMALAIPTTVAVLSATAYEPVNYTEDKPPPADEPVAEPPQPGAAPTETPAPPPAGAPTSRAPKRRAPKVAALPKAPPALIGVGEGQITLSVPAVEVRQAYTRTEVAMYGVKQHAEVAVPMLNVVF